MSKMSQLYLELTESANELGFESYEDAEKAGYRADWNTGAIYKPDEQEEAHKVWEAEREWVIVKLEKLMESDRLTKSMKDTINETINFIKKGEM